MKKSINLLAVFCYFISFGQTDFSTIYESDVIIETGVAFHDQENYDEAIKWYEKITKADNKYLKAQYEKLLTLITAEKNDEARTLFEKLYTNQKMDEMPELYVLYGVFLSNQKEYDASEKAFEKAEKFIPNASYLNFNKAILHLRKEERQQTVECLKKVIQYNPNHATSQYFLGLMALEDGNVAIGSMALLGYIINNPTGSYAKEAIYKLNKNFNKEYINKSQIVFSSKGDDFSELDLILRNGLPLNSKYKLQCKIDDVVTRQIQAVLEYAASHEVKDGFFENYYIPYLAAIYNENQTEGFLYYSLLSIEDDLGKKLTNEKKKIIKFSDDFIKPKLWDYYGSRNLEIKGKTEKVTIWLKEGKPFFVGKNLENYDGNYLLVNEYFQTLSELHYKNGKLEGLQKYFYTNGILKQETHYVSDKKEGESREYYTTGKLKSIENYQNDLIHGKYTSFSPTGNKNCEFNFKNGERDGQCKCYHPDGTLRSEELYVDGKLEGTKKDYSKIGFVLAEYNLKNGELHGETVEYFEPNKIKSKATYNNGKVIGTRFFYDSNGTVSNEEVFENEILSKAVEYYPNGKIAMLANYQKDKTVTYTYHNTNGEPYFKEIIKEGEVLKAFQYKKGKSEPEEIDFSRKPFVIYNLEEVKITEGKLVKGRKEGVWNYYYQNGNIKTIESYEKGISNGIREEYSLEGELLTKSNMVNDKIHGYQEIYENGKKTKSYYHNEGNKTGPYHVHYANGNISYEGFYVENDTHNKQFTYTQEGKSIYENDIWFGYLVNVKRFNLDGTLDYEINYHDLNGKKEIKSNQNLLTIKNEYVFGYKNGTCTVQMKDGTLLNELNYKNGFLHGLNKYFFPNGKISSQNNYFLGNLHGEAQYYDMMGNLRFKSNYLHGVKYGLSQRIYQNKKVLYEYEEMNGYHHGKYTYYNQNGEVLAQINYHLNVPVSYQILDASGKLGNPIKIDKTMTVISKYTDGSVACKIPFENEMLQGKLEIFSKNGTLQYMANYLKNDLNGERIEYYGNGNIYKKENLQRNDFEGIQTYYETDGKLALEVNYKFDEYHGDFKIYTNGVLTKTIHYDSDEIQFIK